LLGVVKRLLPRDRFTRSAAILAGGTTLAQGLALLVAPILTRLYTPNDFGVLAVYISLLALLKNVSSFRYEFAIPIPEDNATAVNVLVLCVLLILTMGTVLTGGLFLFSDKLFQIHRYSVLKQYMWVLPAGLVLAGCYDAFSYWAVRERLYTTIARTSLSQGVAGVLTQLGIGIFVMGPTGLLTGQIVGQSAGLGTLAKQFWKKNREAFLSVTSGSVRAAAYRFRSFPIYQSSSTLLNSAGLQAPALLFAAYYGMEVAGWFYLTQKVLAMPITLIGASVAKVFQGEAARLLNEPEKLKKLFREINLKLLMLGIVPCLVLAFGGKWIFQIVFGMKWTQSGIFVQVMAFVFLLKLSTDSVINFAIIERHDFSFSWAAMRLVLVATGILSAVYMGLPAFWAVVFFAVGQIFSYAVEYLMYSYAINRMIARKERENPVTA
jgi:O-antigen/teichoic acid export membrane protein